MSINGATITYASPTKINCRKNVFNTAHEIPIVCIEYNGMTKYSREFILGNEDIQAMINCYEDQHKTKDAIARLKRKYTAHYVNDIEIDILREMGFIITTTPSRKTEEITGCDFKLPIFNKITHVSFSKYVMTSSLQQIQQDYQQDYHQVQNSNDMNVTGDTSFGNTMYNSIPSSTYSSPILDSYGNYVTGTLQLCHYNTIFEEIYPFVGPEWNALLLNYIIANKFKKGHEFTLPSIQTESNIQYALSQVTFYQQKSI